ncbi:molybdopterin molybdotransferase MoeA [Candidatus Binatia bacterium]|nr:molybdopterin molybdotransferase MoeA [Candidatus Binatia bacterium]
MISVAEAIAQVMSAVVPLAVEEVGIAVARGRVLAADVVASFDIPPFPNSQMDGFAVRSVDLQGASEEAPQSLRVVGTIAAGDAPEGSVGPGDAIRIMTGGAIPPGVDAVVKVEDTTMQGGTVLVRHAPRAGEFLRPAGEDLRTGDRVLEAGRVLRPADVGLLASLGLPTVRVRVRPRVAVLATGDELVELGQPLGPGQIYNSNAYTLAAAVENVGGIAVVFGIVRDTRSALRDAFAATRGFDAVLSTGGVSVGDFDFVKEIMDEQGLERRFWQVAQKPGKPITFAARDGQLFFGLPGNPVSSLVCFELYVAPALRRALGMSEVFAPAVDVVMEQGVRTAKGLCELVRCTLRRDGDRLLAVPTGTQSSGALRSLSLADCLVISPPGTDELAAGTRAVALCIGPSHAPSREHPFR